jgi:hypothetical protein
LPWHEYAGSGIVFVNPPYSQSKRWIAKCVEEASHGAEIVLLVASRTGARWFQPCWRADAGCFLVGRVKFIGAATGAPFDSFLGYWGPHAERFVDVFDGDVGECFRRASPAVPCLRCAERDAAAEAASRAGEPYDPERPTNGVH